jgi:hypothetical protein
MTDTKICQFCGATIADDAENCPMCGSPTTPPPPPTYTGPETVTPLEEPPFIEGAVVQPAEPAEPVFTPPPVSEYRAPAAPQAPSNRGLAVAVEIIAGIFFFLGIGWMIAGKLGVGIGLLVGYWIAVAIYAVILTILSPFTLGFSFLGLCLLPIVPVVSGLILNEKMK